MAENSDKNKSKNGTGTDNVVNIDDIRNKSGMPKGRLVTGSITFIIVAAAFLIFLYRDNFTADAIRSFFTGRQAPAQDVSPFTYETGTMQSFSLAGSGLAVASRTGLHLFDGRGETVARQVFPMTMPAVASSGVHSVFYDIGGTSMRVADFEGECQRLDPSNAIISVTMNDSGWFALTSEKQGYKGNITVYDDKLAEVYSWNCGTGYPLLARIAPDNRSMAVLTVDKSGGKITFLSFNRTDPTGSFLTPDELILDFSYLDTEHLCAISENRIVFFNDAGEQKSQRSFEGMYLTGYEIDDTSFVTVHLSRYLSGNQGDIITLDQQGSELGRLEIYRDLITLSSYGRHLAVLYSDGLVLYNQELEVISESEDAVGIQRALLRDNNEALILSTYAAEIHRF